MGGACSTCRSNKKYIILCGISKRSRSQWPRGLKRRSAAARLPGLWVLIPPRHGCLSVMNVACCEIEADHSSRGVIPTVVRRFVCSLNLRNEVMTRVWQQHHSKKRISEGKRSEVWAFFTPVEFKFTEVK
jgi:hypothetical protein